MTTKRIFWTTGIIALLFFTVSYFLPKIFRQDMGSWVITFHTLIMLLGSAVLLRVCIFVLRHQKTLGNNRNIIIAAALFTTALFDVLHALSFGGMPQTIIFPNISSSYYFWIAGQVVLAAGIILSLRFDRQERSEKITQLSFVTATLIIWIVYAIVAELGGRVPALAGIRGAEPLRVMSEYAVVAMFCAAIYIYWRRIRADSMLYDLLSFLIMVIMSETFSILASTPVDLYSVLSHIFKFAAYIYLAQALCRTFMDTPEIS